MLVTQQSSTPQTLSDLLSPAFLQSLDRLDVLSRQVFSGKLPGERRSKKRGHSVEFDDYRQYVAGDDLRHVDWNVFARMDRFFIKLFREEEDLAVHVALDASASMDAGRPSKRLLGLKIAVALCSLALSRQNRVVASVFGLGGERGAETSDALRGRVNLQRLAAFLVSRGGPSAPMTGPRASFNDDMRALTLHRAGKGVMVVVSDFLIPGSYARGLNYLSASSGFDTHAVQVLTPEELDPALAGEQGFAGDLRLLDAEGGRGAEVTVSPALIKRYRARLAKHQDAMIANLTARRITHTLVRTNEPIEALLMDRLRRVGLLR